MASSRIKIISWGAQGPTYDVITRNTGFRNRRNRVHRERHGSTPNARLDRPAFVYVDGAVLFNKGFVYAADLVIDGSETTEAKIDATDDFVVFETRNGVHLEHIEALVDGDDGDSEEE